MNRIKIFVTLVVCLATTAVVLTGCMGRSSNAMSNGGELVGVRGSSQSEATPYGMVAVGK